jgi:XdhC and CoxI family
MAGGEGRKKRLFLGEIGDAAFRLARFRLARYLPVAERRQIMLSTNDDILKAAEDWRNAGRQVALATVVETWGSAPRPVGSNLVIDGEGNFLGSVSGGCVEGAVVTEALDVIESGQPKMLEFGVADETAWKVGLSCGGTIRVFVEKVD